MRTQEKRDMQLLQRQASRNMLVRLLLLTLFSILYEYLIPIRLSDSVPVVTDVKCKHSLLQEHTLIDLLIS